MKLEYQLSLRLPEQLADKLKHRTSKTNRSMNAEIVYLLNQYFDVDNMSISSKLNQIVSLAESLQNDMK